MRIPTGHMRIAQRLSRAAVRSNSFHTRHGFTSYFSCASHTKRTSNQTTMAPMKKDGEKEAKLTPEQSAAVILDYLRKQNRPYSATDISSNLKNRVTKAAAAKLLKDMHERNEIEGRAAGKQIVYHVIQVCREAMALSLMCN